VARSRERACNDVRLRLRCRGFAFLALDGVERVFAAIASPRGSQERRKSGCRTARMKLGELSDAQLLESLESLCGQGRVLLARLLAHLAEVEGRRLHLEAACPSMLQFCMCRLGMSEDEACRRIRAARLVRRFPDLLVRIERGDLTRSTIALLHEALTEESYAEVVEAAAGKTKAEVRARSSRSVPPRPTCPRRSPSSRRKPPYFALGGDAAPDRTAASCPQLLPLSETRHKVQFTASDELREKLEHAQDLMRHANAGGDLAIVVERAVDLLLQKLERKRLGKTSRPGQPREEADDARVSRATRRVVFERDGERCTFTDAEGHRCPAKTWLELDHVVPRARGGTSEVGNLRVRCRAHNLLFAEQTFGKEHVERRIRERRDPRQRGYASESWQLAASGLANMGFRATEVRSALDTVSGRHRAERAERDARRDHPS
jgi:hypothetical protein